MKTIDKKVLSLEILRYSGVIVIGAVILVKFLLCRGQYCLNKFLPFSLFCWFAFGFLVTGNIWFVPSGNKDVTRKSTGHYLCAVIGSVVAIIGIILIIITTVFFCRAVKVKGKLMNYDQSALMADVEYEYDGKKFSYYSDLPNGEYVKNEITVYINPKKPSSYKLYNDIGYLSLTTVALIVSSVSNFILGNHFKSVESKNELLE